MEALAILLQIMRCPWEFCNPGLSGTQMLTPNATFYKRNFLDRATAPKDREKMQFQIANHNLLSCVLACNSLNDKGSL